MAAQQRMSNALDSVLPGTSASVIRASHRLAAARREILFPELFSGTASETGSLEIDLDLIELLLAA